MHFNSLTLSNFKCYSSLEWNTIHKKVNLLVGGNGAGKTAILEALTVILGGYFRDIPVVSSYNPRPQWVRVDREREFIACYPVSVETSIEIDDNNFILLRTKPSNDSKYTTKGINKLAELGQTAYLVEKNRQKPPVLDLITYYSTKRLHVPKNLKKQDNAGRFAGYASCLDEENGIKNLMAWYKEVTKVAIQEVQQNPEHQDATLALLDGFLLKVISNPSLKLGQFRKVYYDLRDDVDEIVLVEQNGNKLPLSYYSDGFRNIFYLIFDMAARAVILNKSVENFKIENIGGVVLIDEIDLHLHPSWQSMIIELLAEHFKNIQFFITTHSPIVINHLKDNYGAVFEVTHEGVSRVELAYGKSSSATLRDIMRFYNDVPPEVQRLLKEYRAAKMKGTIQETEGIRQELLALTGKVTEEMERIDKIAAIR